jgi:glycoprotein-N-acetylgalactosamine 3-beta-galactosyltransferase
LAFPSYQCVTLRTDASVPTVKLAAREDYDYIWGKTKQAWQYVHDHYLQDADWFFKADDDT